MLQIYKRVPMLKFKFNQVSYAIYNIIAINLFVPNAPFSYLLKTSETHKVFSMFSGGREKVYWEQMG